MRKWGDHYQNRSPSHNERWHDGWSFREGEHAVDVRPALMRALRDPKRKPTHPGAVLREDVLPALGMTQTELARRLGVSRLTVSELSKSAA